MTGMVCMHMMLCNLSQSCQLRRCGSCDGCSLTGVCANCRDMKKFGGLGHRKQAYIYRKCTLLTRKRNGIYVGIRRRGMGVISLLAP